MANYGYKDLPPAYQGKENYVFISYPHARGDVIYDDLWELHNSGVRFWYDVDIKKGADWKKYVKPRIDKAKVVLIYVDKNTCFSQACEREIAYIKQHKKRYIPIYRVEPSYRQVKARALLENEKDFTEEREELFDKVFDPSIIGVVCKNDMNDYYAELKDSLKSYKVSSKTLAIERKKKRAKKILIVAKNSQLCRSITQGILDTMSNSDEFIVDKKLLSGIEEDKLSDTMAQEIEKEIQQYDIFVLRPNRFVSKKLFDVIHKHYKDKKIVLFDVDLSKEQKKLFDAKKIPIFVSTDFVEGGNALAKKMVEVFYQLDPNDTLVLTCLGPKTQESIVDRCNAMESYLKQYIKPSNLLFHELKSYYPDQEIPAICETIKNADTFGYNNLVIFAGNDSISSALMGWIDSRTTQAFKKFNQIVFVGYDGIKHTMTNQYLVDNKRSIFVTMDVQPQEQGKQVALAIKNNVDKNVYCKAELVFNTNKLPSQYINSIVPLSFLKDKKVAIWDIDGTIADNEPYHWKAYHELFKQFHLTVKPDDIARYIGHPDMEIYDMVKKDYKVSFNNKDMFEKRLKIYLNLLKKDKLQPYQWVKDFIKHYSNVPIYVVTSQIPKVIDELFSFWGLDQYIPKSHIISISEKKIDKKEVYTHLEKYIKKPIERPIDVVVFEDSDYALKLAREQNYVTFGIAHEFSRGHLPNASFIIDETYAKGLFIGLSTIDVVYKINNYKYKPNNKVVVDNLEFQIGGPAARASVTFANLVGNGTLLSAIGMSNVSEILVKELFNKKVNLIRVSGKQEQILPSTSCVILDTKTSTRSIVNSQMLKADFDLISKYINRTHFDFALYDSNFDESTEKIINLLKQKKMPIVLDCGAPKPHSEYAIKHSDYPICSSRFLQLTKKKMKNVAITNNEKPIIYFDEKGKQNKIPVHNVKNANTLVAGDTFHGAFCYYKFCLKQSFGTALKSASKYVEQVLLDGLKKQQEQKKK